MSLKFAKWNLTWIVSNNYFGQCNAWNKTLHLATLILKKLSNCRTSFANQNNARAPREEM
jgi:hypothetical protein